MAFDKAETDRRKCQDLYDSDPAIREMLRRLINAGMSIDKTSQFMGTRTRVTTSYQHKWNPHTIMALCMFFGKRITDLSMEGFAGFLKEKTEASFKEVVDKKKTVSKWFGWLIAVTILLPVIIYGALRGETQGLNLPAFIAMLVVLALMVLVCIKFKKENTVPEETEIRNAISAGTISVEDIERLYEKCTEKKP